MKKRFFLGMVTSLVLWLCPIASYAISLDFVPGTQSVALGTSVTVDVVVSGLTAATEIVSAFDLDVTYDSTVLSATGVTFGPSLGDPFFFEVFEDFDISTAGVVDFAALSLLSDGDLAALQGDSVTLATLSFDTIGVGTSSLGFILDAFNDVKGRNAAVLSLTVGPGSVTVNGPNPIPEPGTMLLLGTGLAGLAAWRLRRQQDS